MPPPAAEPNAPIMPMKRSAMPCVDARSAGEERVGEQRAAGDEREVPTDTVEKQAESQRAIAARREPGEHHGADQHERRPRHRERPRRCTATDSGEATGHAAGWRDTATPITCTVTLVVQVDRRRRGRTDRRTADRERRQRELHADVGQDLPDDAPSDERPSAALVELARDRQRSGRRNSSTRRRHGSRRLIRARRPRFQTERAIQPAPAPSGSVRGSIRRSSPDDGPIARPRCAGLTSAAA
jgi:hypothetical protein